MQIRNMDFTTAYYLTFEKKKMSYTGSAPGGLLLTNRIP